MRLPALCVFAALPLVMWSCSGRKTVTTFPMEATFGDDVAFLESHTKVHVLKDADSGARVAVVPAWQGRVMTSTAGGGTGPSMGWLHRENIAAGIKPEGEREGLAKHIHIFGGEERFWLGPEGGQYALFFPPPPAEYVFDTWKTPALLDTEAFEVVSGDDLKIRFAKEAELTNRAGTVLKLRIERDVELLPKPAITGMLGLELTAGVSAVAYRTSNTLINRGSETWAQEKGLVSIWLLGMFKHGPGVTAVVPLKDGPGNAVNSDYFGPLEKDRLVATDKAVFFKADGAYRSKIGVPPARSTGVAGAYDPERGVLTIVRAVPPPAADALPYVRSQWVDHEKPYAGDLINAYNDGPPAPGEAPLGPFYELETSSPALPLAPGGKLVHVQETMHFTGTAAALDPIATKVLGVSIAEITGVFPKQ
jgi:hypothetical protein